MSGFVHVERVRFGDLDGMRHLNNVVFLRYFETARIQYLHHLVPDHDPANPEASAFGLIFAECHINYRSTVQYDQTVAVTCSIADVRRSSVRIPFDMHVEDRLVAEGHGVLVGFDYTQERAAPLPDDVRARFEREAEQD